MRLLHHMNLTLFGGLQTHFLRFLEYSARRHGYDNSVWLEQPAIHHAARAPLRGHARWAGHPRYHGRVKLPGWPAALRRRREQRMFARAAADTGIIWDGFNRLRIVRAFAAHGLRPVYWEHGASWYSHHDPDKTGAFFDEIDTVLCNSHAARRMLQLRWGCERPIALCLNGVAASERSRAPRVRDLPVGRPFRIGTAGHLRTYKGAHIAIKAVHELVRRGHDVELWIAGTGPKEAEMRAFCRRLGVAERVRFCGFVADMQGFYDALDCYLHPAMREAFGLVCAEAALAGCPVIATRVDGLPEVVQHERTGLCIEPTCDSAALADLETALEPRVDCVYDPIADRIAAPRFIDPADLAEAVAALAGDGDRLARFSANAIADAAGRLSYTRHMDDVHVALGSI
ncbi:hypothetical protein SAOR_14045 [Salinisphaera orenii MK-B5]|uniref:Uncharacterized protein n=1 Tax=Salinisphaera orenii MK-B5 TaxID=856730 RepID=A0A423PGQ3_9GAMM|nr:glycosyltransferase [Salinisphaera orenii]ROO24745.1 hypothetical protein SAOR_14045 [Salinisphaera orenii MK-B5]